MPTATLAPETASRLHLLVFGLPGSGKSSLLGALMQTGTAQAAVLKGQIVDDTGRLAELRKSTYTESGPAATEGMAVYPLRFVPQGREKSPISATLVDGDGRLAQQYLTGKRVFQPRDSALVREMLAADTVILTLEATRAGGQVEAQLASFAKFLTRLEEVRGGRVDVADLPVYLVLTKCDELAQPDDTSSIWMQRIEEAKRKLAERFAAFLSDDPHGPAFGTIDLQLWATAISRPALADRPAPAAEPYGVAELFRQCFASAESFEHRERRASRRLELTVGGLGMLVVMLGLIAGLFAALQPDTERTRLEERVQTALPEPDAPVDRRLRAPLKDRLEQIERLQDDPAFDTLPAKTREAVRQTADEMRAYLKTRQEYQAQVKHPFLAKNEEEFVRYEEQARDFALPPSYAEAWADTSLARQLVGVRQEYKHVRKAVAEKVAWMRVRIDEGKKLDDQAYSVLVPSLLKADRKTREQLAKPWFAAFANYRQQPSYYRPSDEAVPGASSMVYADLDKFHDVRAARKDWDRIRRDLDETHDLIAKRVAQ
jgi:GTPase SAR1 family protein